MLQNRIPIRHPRNVIRHRASAPSPPLGGLGLQRQVPMLGRHETYVLEERPEERLENATGLGRHAEHLVVLVDALVEELHELDMFLAGGVTEADEGLREGTDVIDRAGTGLVEARLGGADEVDDDEIDHPPDDLVDQAALAKIWVLCDDGVVLAAEEADFAQFAQVHELRADAVVNVVIVVRDLVRQVRDLSLEAGLLPVDKPLTQLPELTRIAHGAML